MELAEIQKRFEADRFASHMGARILEAAPGYARCALTLADWHRNAAGGVMGGVTFTLADFAFAIAANHEKLDTVSLVSQINYLGQARGDQLFAEARCDKSGRTTCLYTIRITDQEGRLVAQVATTGFITG